MARGLNKVMLIGNLGGDPDIRYTTQGDAVANFSLATAEQWQKDGEKHSRTTWHKIVAWRKLAEIIGEWCKKGQQIYVEGKLTVEEWEKDGIKRQTTKIVIDQMIMLGGGDRDAQPRQEPQEPERLGGDFSGGREQQGFGGGFEGQQIPDDDIPF